MGQGTDGIRDGDDLWMQIGDVLGCGMRQASCLQRPLLWFHTRPASLIVFISSIVLFVYVALALLNIH